MEDRRSEIAVVQGELAGQGARSRLPLVPGGACAGIRKAVVALAAGLCLAGAVHASGVPTVDVAAITQAVMQYSQMLEQYATLGQQLATQGDIKSIAAQALGYKGLDRAITTDSSSMFSAEVESAINAIRSSGYGGLTPRAKSIYNEMGLGVNCGDTDDGTNIQKTCIRSAALLAQKIAAYEEAREVGVQNQKLIEQSLKGIQNSTDMKGAAEAQAAIQKLTASFQSQVQRFQVFKERIELEQQVAAVAEKSAQREYTSSMGALFKNSKYGKGN